MFKKIGAVVLSTSLVLSGLSIGTVDAKPDAVDRKGKGNKKVENVIFMVPDGFSADYASNYRVYKGKMQYGMII